MVERHSFEVLDEEWRSQESQKAQLNQCIQFSLKGLLFAEC